MVNPDSRAQYTYLLRHFFRRFFDFEAISSPQIDSIEKNALTFQVLALMVLPGLIECWFLIQKYAYYTYRPTIERDLATLTDKCFLLSLSMILLGVISVFEWDMLFPDRKDYLILTPMPVTMRTIFYSKCTALAAFLLVFTVAINLIPTFMCPGAILQNNGFAYRVLGKTVPISVFIRYIASHAVSTLLANIFIFFSVISFQGILLTLSPPKLAPAISRWARFSFLLVFLSALFLLPQVSSVDQLIYRESPMSIYYPPIWFVGVYQILLGSHDAVFWALGGRAVSALFLSGILSLLTYAICYRRFTRRSIESGSGALQNSAGVKKAGNLMLDSVFLRKSGNRATYHFVGQTIFRSPRHVLYIGTFFVLGFAIAAMEFTALMFSKHSSGFSRFDNNLLSIPLILAFFLLVGMRVSFAIPVDLDANWLFRLAPIGKIRESHTGLRVFLIGAIIFPLFMVAALAYALIWDWQLILLHIGYGITLSLILMELLFSRFPKIPFTCSYLPGAAQLVILWPIYILGFKCFGYAAANLEIWFLSETYRFFYFYGIAAALLLLLVHRNLQSAGSGIRFEEESERAPIYLDLKG